MFDVIPYWMWASSLLVLALVCGAALSTQESRDRHKRIPLQVRQPAARARRWMR
jgi:hypothetical protein